jgi:hypothetical protein
MVSIMLLWAAGHIPSKAAHAINAEDTADIREVFPHPGRSIWTVVDVMPRYGTSWKPRKIQPNLRISLIL